MIKSLSAFLKLHKYDEQRARFRWYLLISILAIIIGAMIPLPCSKLPNWMPGKCKITIPSDPDFNLNQTVSTIIVSIFTSATAACLIEISSGIRDVLINEEKQKKFRELFGCGLKPNTVAIVVPRFPMERLQKLPNNVRTQLEGLSLDQTAIQSLRSDKNFLASADIKAAIDILIEFKNRKLPLPEIKWDDEILEIWENRELQFNTLIVIGLFSNRFSMYYSQHESKKSFKLEQSGVDQPCIVKIAQWGNNRLLSVDETPKKYQKDNHAVPYPYGLLAKARTSGKTFFFVGGIGEQETQYIAKYLIENWEQSLYSWKDPHSPLKSEIKGNDFVMWVDLRELNGKVSGAIEHIIVGN